jgi:ABC-type transport system substrate-binding protein
VIDQPARAAIYKQIAELAAKDLPFAVVNNYNDSFAITTRVHGVLPVPDGLVRLNTVWLES